VPVRCLIVDDNPEFLQVATRLLTSEGIEVVGVASSSVDAVRSWRELRPDVALVDIKLGEESGFDLVPRLVGTNGGPAHPVILISTYAERDFADLIAASPAVGFVSKSRLSGAAIRGLLEANEPPGR
jgi:CheY-like chemotaxis protein